MGVLLLEYKRNERKDEAKKRKEEDYRKNLDDFMHRDREVSTQQVTFQGRRRALSSNVLSGYLVVFH